jgi:signal transduction histidine kinase
MSEFNAIHSIFQNIITLFEEYNKLKEKQYFSEATSNMNDIISLLSKILEIYQSENKEYDSFYHCEYQSDEDQVYVQISYLLADYFYQQKNLILTETYLLKAIQYENKVFDTILLEKVYQKLSDLYQEKQDFYKAFIYLEKCNKLSLINQDNASKKAVHDFENAMNLEAKKKNSEIFRLKNIELKKINAFLSNKKDDIQLINSILRHDITNNLVAVKSSIRIMQRTQENNYIEDAISYLKKSVALIHNMRDLETFLSENKGLKMYDLVSVIKDVIRNYPSLEFSVTGSCKVVADEALVSIFDNLFSNAILHGNTSKIEISIIPKYPNCEIHVKDNGICIPDEWKEKIFNEHVTYGEKAHTGLGLYIVYKTIERYGGFIFVTDNQPKGCVFTFSLKMVR